MSKVIIHLMGGGSYETTEQALPNVQRMMAGKITGIERPGQNLASAITEELVVEVEETKPETVVEEITETVDENRLPTLDELRGTDKDVLRKMANDIAESKSITKPNARLGVEKLSQWIFDNQ